MIYVSGVISASDTARASLWVSGGDGTSVVKPAVCVCVVGRRQCRRPGRSLLGGFDRPSFGLFN